MHPPVFHTLADWQTWLSSFDLEENITFGESLTLRHFYNLQGALSLSLLPRLKESLYRPHPKTTIQFSWLLNPKAVPLPQLSMAVTADLPLELTCQRCLSAMPFSLESQSSFWIATDEAQLEEAAIDPEAEAFFKHEPIHLLQLIEDETLLAIPYSPRHPENQCKMQPTEPETVQGKPHPFAALAQLKKVR